jgi:alpha-N-acetylglucosamine transferase
MSRELFKAPDSMKRADGSSRFAFVTFLMLNDSYLPGVLVLAYALREQNTRADLVCMVTDGITSEARHALELLFDHVVDVPEIYVPHKRRQERQDRPYFFTRMNALRLGSDGDLGFEYEKVVVLDADLLPLKYYDHLFSLNAPAGIINEQKSHFVENNPDGSYSIPESVKTTGTWKWHRLYGEICPHGHPIPVEITDRVKQDPSNLGINGSLLVFDPSMSEFNRIREDVQKPDVLHLVGDLFDWPDMQYLTMRWSGRWTNVDLRFDGFNGYPELSVLFGTHFGGLKPWQFRRAKAIARWGRYDDYQLWFREYTRMVTETYPELGQIKRLATLLNNIRELNESLRGVDNDPG